MPVIFSVFAVFPALQKAHVPLLTESSKLANLFVSTVTLVQRDEPLYNSDL